MTTQERSVTPSVTLHVRMSDQRGLSVECWEGRQVKSVVLTQIVGSVDRAVPSTAYRRSVEGFKMLMLS